MGDPSVVGHAPYSAGLRVDGKFKQLTGQNTFRSSTVLLRHVLDSQLFLWDGSGLRVDC